MFLAFEGSSSSFAFIAYGLTNSARSRLRVPMGAEVIMKRFDSLPRHAVPPTIRAPVTFQGFGMLSTEMKTAANVLSAAPGMKSYEIPPTTQPVGGALGERAHRGAKSSAGCGCGPCGA